ncbi:MAG: DUF3592 domain-containing protein [Bacillota bacterium]|nr:DUF3592 domain-containing protein [Bacillota bacterium]
MSHQLRAALAGVDRERMPQWKEKDYAAYTTTPKPWPFPSDENPCYQVMVWLGQTRSSPGYDGHAIGAEFKPSCAPEMKELVETLKPLQGKYRPQLHQRYRAMIQEDSFLPGKDAPEKPEEKRRQKRREIFWYVVILLAGMMLIILGARTLRQALASRSWPACQGRIISSEVKMYHPGPTLREEGPSYSAEILYEYRVEGKRYTSRRVFFGEYSSGSPGPARRVVDRYPPGKQVPVYYDPARPEVAVLEPGASWGAFAVLGVGILFSLVGFFAVLWTWQVGD